MRRKRLNATELIDQASGALREYQDEKQKIYEESITTVENRSTPWLGILFIGLIVGAWYVAVVHGIRADILWDQLRLLPVVIFFLVSYFAVFLTSKLAFRPRAEELADDTSYVAPFSACSARARRGWYSIVIAILHTAAFFIFVVGKQVG